VDAEAHREIPKEVAERFVQLRGYSYIECSALSGDFIEDVFQLLILKIRKSIQVTI
jgi:hypothetical protein